MKNLLKNSLKVLSDYAISLVIFGVFIVTFIEHRVIYSGVIFVIMCSIIYADMKQLAIKEKRPQYDLKPHTLKGLIFGLIGFSPFIILTLVYPHISFESELYNNLKRLIYNGLLGPVYFIAKLGGGSFAAYLTATLVVPVIAMLSYMAGYYGFNFPSLRKPKGKDGGKTDKKSPVRR